MQYSLLLVNNSSKYKNGDLPYRCQVEFYSSWKFDVFAASQVPRWEGTIQTIFPTFKHAHTVKLINNVKHQEYLLRIHYFIQFFLPIKIISCLNRSQ